MWDYVCRAGTQVIVKATVGFSILFRENQILNIFIFSGICSGNEMKHSVELCHSTRNVLSAAESGVRKCRNEERSFVTVGSQVPSAYSTM